jgi:predicted ribosomally synthesized peptide with SipW-like signal peptide
MLYVACYITKNMKKILLSVAVIAVVAAVVVGVTTAFFSDTETSTGNTFTAGSLDLKVDNTCHYWQNGQDIGCVNEYDEQRNPILLSDWTSTDLVPGIHKFFSFGDVKPGDKGEDTISLTVVDNPAWACAKLGPLTNLDNECTEPEATDGDVTCDDKDEAGAPKDEGELGEYLNFMIWADVCKRLETPGHPELPGPALPCDNVYQPECDILLTSGPANGDPLNGTTWTIADASGNVFTGEGPLAGNTKYCIGMGWELPSGTGNIVQSDSVSGDISFYVEQARNNENFLCNPVPVTAP